MSANVAVSETLLVIVSGSGLVALTTSPLQPLNPQPATGVAVSETPWLNAYRGWSGLFATLPCPTTETATVKLSLSKLAAIVCAAVTLVKSNVVTAPTEPPSTSTSATWRPASGVMANAWSAPQFTTTLPDGLIVPPVPALAVIV